MVIQKRLTVILANSNKRPRPHINDYGKFQPAKVREYSINANILYSKTCYLYHLTIFTNSINLPLWNDKVERKRKM